MLGFGKFISPQGLKELKNYKYVGGAYTPGDKAMQPFWEWFVTLLPLVSIGHLVLMNSTVVGSSKFDNTDCSFCFFY